MGLPGTLHRILIVSVLVEVAFWYSCSCHIAHGGPLKCDTAAPSAAQHPEMSNLNEDFRQIYQMSKANELKSLGPVIVVEGGKAFLMQNGNAFLMQNGAINIEAIAVTKECNYIPAPKYDILKAIDHVPLAIFVLLDRCTQGDGKLDSKEVEALAHLHDLSLKASAILQNYELSPAESHRQKSIFADSLQFMATVLKSKKVSSSQLFSFTRRMTPYMMENANDAVSLELTGLNRAIMSWKKDMTEEQWHSLHVIVVDGHMAAKQNHIMQYFCKLLGEPDEGRRIVYFEHPLVGNPTFGLLGTHILDERIGKAFFNDPTRMHRDLLSDAASKYLQEHSLDLTPGSTGTGH